MKPFLFFLVLLASLNMTAFSQTLITSGNPKTIQNQLSPTLFDRGMKPPVRDTNDYAMWEKKDGMTTYMPVTLDGYKYSTALGYWKALAPVPLNLVTRNELMDSVGVIGTSVTILKNSTKGNLADSIALLRGVTASALRDTAAMLRHEDSAVILISQTRLSDTSIRLRDYINGITGGIRPALVDTAAALRLADSTNRQAAISRLGDTSVSIRNSIASNRLGLLDSISKINLRHARLFRLDSNSYIQNQRHTYYGIQDANLYVKFIETSQLRTSDWQPGYNTAIIKSLPVNQPAVRIEHIQMAPYGWPLELLQNGKKLGFALIDSASVDTARWKGNFLSRSALYRGWIIAPDYISSGVTPISFLGTLLLHSNYRTGFGISLSVPRISGVMNMDSTAALQIDTLNRVFLRATAQGVAENAGALLGINTSGRVVKTTAAKQGTPTSSSDPAGQAGEIWYDTDYIYTRSATGWGRSMRNTSF